jgi:hypothetical protein
MKLNIIKMFLLIFIVINSCNTSEPDCGNLVRYSVNKSMKNYDGVIFHFTKYEFTTKRKIVEDSNRYIIIEEDISGEGDAWMLIIFKDTTKTSLFFDNSVYNNKSYIYFIKSIKIKMDTSDIFIKEYKMVGMFDNENVDKQYICTFYWSDDYGIIFINGRRNDRLLEDMNDPSNNRVIRSLNQYIFMKLHEELSN